MEEDWTNPDFVFGAVLAQLEDLKPFDKYRTLVRALMVVRKEIFG